MFSGVKCYDVAATRSGHLLAARTGGLDVIDASSKQLLKSLKLGLRVFTVAVHNNTIILGVRLSYTLSTIIILDSEYNELNRWSVSGWFWDFIALDNSVYI